MGELNRAWALEVLHDYVWAATKVPTGEETRYGHPQKAFPVTTDDLQKRLHVAEQVVRRVLPSEQRSLYSGYNSPAYLRWLALKAIAELERDEELRQNLGDVMPPVTAGELHPWVWEGATPYWRIGAYNSAIGQALIRLNAEVQRKLGRRDIGEGDAFAQAFTLDPPQPGKPRLRVMDNDGSKTYQDVHRGAMLLGQALYAGVRNPMHHDALDDPSEQEALETMAAISLLARWTDRACVAHVEEV